jgi:hypothetical protein
MRKSRLWKVIKRSLNRQESPRPASQQSEAEMDRTAKALAEEAAWEELIRRHSSKSD